MQELILRGTDWFKNDTLRAYEQQVQFYLGMGNKNVGYLSERDVDEQIKAMKYMYLSLPKNKRQGVPDLDKINEYSKLMDHRAALWKKDLGRGRTIDLFKEHSRKANEVFFSIEYRPENGYANNTPTKREYGYIEVTPRMREMFDTLIQDRRDAMSIEFIEWDDSWNMVFNDGLCISSKMCRVEKEDFNNWRNNINKEDK